MRRHGGWRPIWTGCATRWSRPCDRPNRRERHVAVDEEPWTWPEATWRAHVDRVRAGRSLAPARWPGGATVAVALSFASDHETIPLRGNETSPGKLSQGEYGARVAVPRVLDLLSRRGIPATF